MTAKGAVMSPLAANAARLTRTKGYPYARPSSSFLYANGRPYIFDDGAWTEDVGSILVTGPEGTTERADDLIERLGIPWNAADVRTPVLAIGSNAGPEQLLRKYPPDLFPRGVAIPCVRCMLLGFDVAFAPLLSSYGSCTATLERSEGTAVELFVTFLTEAQLQRMHETEGAYFLNRLRRLSLHLGLSLEAYRDRQAGVSVLETAYQYNHQSGTLHLPLRAGGTSPVAIREIRALDRRFPALNQVQMQRAVRAYVTGQQQQKQPAANNNGNGAAAARTNGYVAGAGPAVKSAAHAEAAAQVEATAEVPVSRADAAEAAAKEAEAAGETALLDVDMDEVHVPESMLDAWILENLDQPDTRTQRVDVLVAAAQPLAYEHVDVLQTFGNIYDRNVD